MALPNEYSIGQTLMHLKHIAPKGFALGCHIQFAAPKVMFNAYPRPWIDAYARDGLLIHDPTVRWGMSHQGLLRWEDITDDPQGVMRRAAAHGLVHGISLTIDDDGRSFGGLAREDRPFSEADVAEAQAGFARLHALTRDLETLDTATRARLEALSIAVIFN